MIRWNRSLFFKAASLLCIFLIVFYSSSLRPNILMQNPQNASITVSGWPLRSGSSHVTHRSRPESISGSLRNVKFLVQNSSDSSHNNSTREISLVAVHSRFNLDRFSNANLALARKPKINDEIDRSTLFSDYENLTPLCPSQPASDLNGPIDIDIEYESLASIEQRFRNRLELGGYSKPNHCKQKNNRVAIVIPYRNRVTHLSIFLKNIHPFLMKQQADYGVFVIEQFGNGLFNRGALMNIGFLEARKLSRWDCFIFNDVDLIPLDDRNLYSKCPKQPRHMSVAIDTMQFKLPYSSIFGGVSAMTAEQFQSVNGFSNAFFGWGGEDDDLHRRLKHAGYHIARYPNNIARYKMLDHPKEIANPKRFENLESGAKRFDSEGLNSIKYEIRANESKVLYTWILAEIKSVPNN